MRGVKIYIILPLLFVWFSGCKEKRSFAAVPADAVFIVDTSSTSLTRSNTEIVNGLHLRLAERMGVKTLEDSSAAAFLGMLKYSKAMTTLVLPDAVLSCSTCDTLNWEDYFLRQAIETPQISGELNGFKPQFTVTSASGKDWVFSRVSDSLLVEDSSGTRYIMWQTDIRAANGVLHLLRPIGSPSD